jgi:hypothetical protein
MQVFISYSSRDRIEALKVEALVDQLGHDAWMDVFDLRAGSPLTAELEEKVKASGAVLLLLSPFALESHWVTDEIGYARQAQANGLLFVPILLRPASISDALGDLRAIDATRGLDSDTFRLELERALGGEADRAMILDAETRASLADQALVEKAEAAFPGIKEDVRALLDQPIRKLRLIIDQRMWPTPDRSILRIELQIDIFMGAATISLAPYREGRTWPQDAGFEERPPDEFFGDPKPRIDARFSLLGRSFKLRPILDGTDLGELPIEFNVELDGSEFTGEERASTMLLAERFELPSIRGLMEKRSAVDLWKRAGDEPEVRVDPHTTDIEMRVYATFLTAGVTRDLRLWSSRRARDETVLERCQTLAECESPIEREILLDAFYPRPLRQSEISRSRSERIGNALDDNKPIPEEDGWAAFRMMKGASDVLALRKQYPQAAEEFHKALSHLPADLALDRDPYGAVFEYWNAIMRLAALLEKAGSADDALRFYADETVRVVRDAAERNPDEPDFLRAHARALIHRVRLFQNRFGAADVQDLEGAEKIMDALAHDSDLPWRAQEAEQIRKQAAELRLVLHTPAADSAPGSRPAPAKWLDQSARSKEDKLLLNSALLRYSTFISERLPWGEPSLQLVGTELVQLFRSEKGWFCISIAETGSNNPSPSTKETVLERAALALATDADCSILKWEPTENLGDLVERLHLEEAHAVRTVIRRKNNQTLCAYILEARTPMLRWMVTLGFPSSGDDWKNVAQDDASAAITFSVLRLG